MTSRCRFVFYKRNKITLCRSVPPSADGVFRYFLRDQKVTQKSPLIFAPIPLRSTAQKPWRLLYPSKAASSRLYKLSSPHFGLPSCLRTRMTLRGAKCFFLPQRDLIAKPKISVFCETARDVRGKPPRRRREVSGGQLQKGLFFAV